MPIQQTDNTRVAKTPVPTGSYTHYDPKALKPGAKPDTGTITEDTSSPIRRAIQNYTANYLNSNFANSPFMDVMRWLPGLSYMEKVVTGQPVGENESLSMVMPMKTIRLYRAQPVHPKPFDIQVFKGEEARRNFVGKWFTPNKQKVNIYASQYSAGRTPVELQYVDVPESELEKYLAKKVVPNTVDMEIFEDYIIPESIKRTTIPFNNTSRLSIFKQNVDELLSKIK